MRGWLSAHWGAVLIYLAAASLIAFLLMGIDKGRARRGDWRVPEKTLFLAALLGGALGAVLGMRAFHHKTRHWYFRFGMPAILMAQVALGLWIWLG